MKRDEIKIISGAQTGVDQGALQAAIDLGLEWGGSVPKGWRTENGTVGAVFRPKMTELASSNYLILTQSYPLSGGTLKTRFFCEEAMRSHFVVSFGEADAVAKVRTWLGQFFAAPRTTPFVLNVAGPRESKASGIQKQTRRFLAEVLSGMLEGDKE